MLKNRSNNKQIWQTISSIWGFFWLSLIAVEAVIFLTGSNLGLSDRIQAGSIVALVFVTLFYAIQTKKLVDQAKDQAKGIKKQAESTYQLSYETKVQSIRTGQLVFEQKLSRDLLFNERRLQEFFNPFIYYLDLAIQNYGESKLDKISELLSKPKVDILFKYSYMLSPPAYKQTSICLTDLFLAGIDEHNNQLEEGSRKKLFADLSSIRKLLHGQRPIIEDYVRNSYPFPEIVSTDETRKETTCETIDSRKETS